MSFHIHTDDATQRFQTKSCSTAGSTNEQHLRHFQITKFLGYAKCNLVITKAVQNFTILDLRITVLTKCTTVKLGGVSLCILTPYALSKFYFTRQSQLGLL